MSNHVKPENAEAPASPTLWNMSFSGLSTQISESSLKAGCL